VTIAESGCWNEDVAGHEDANITRREETWVRNAYHNFCIWKKSARVQCSQPVFTRGGTGLCVKDKGPSFSCKAYNGRCLTAWLAEVSQVVAAQTPPGAQKKLMEKIATCLYLLNNMYCVMEGSTRFLYNNEGTSMRIAMENFVKVCDSLGKDFAMTGSIRFCFLPKHHNCLHIGQFAEMDKYNPRFYHCYADEDHMGALKSQSLRLLVLLLVHVSGRHHAML
jgi:hypothetical protein